ncbi:MAG: hypothetical protein M5U12_08640, partial [Verrucomicrobia bacterium]|nr:hypothetical protein [Verrucomicrobiota bacterium]
NADGTDPRLLTRGLADQGADHPRWLPVAAEDREPLGRWPCPDGESTPVPGTTESWRVRGGGRPRWRKAGMAEQRCWKPPHSKRSAPA